MCSSNFGVPVQLKTWIDAIARKAFAEAEARIVDVVV